MDESLPETAIAAFERATGLGVVLHAPDDHRAGLLSPERFLHQQPICATAKKAGLARCTAFDGLRTAASLTMGEVRIKCCHAGIVEWVTAVPLGAGRWWRLFAGQRRPGPGLLPDLVQTPSHGPWMPLVARLPAAGREEARWIAEMLAQLRARLIAWAAGSDRGADTTPLPAGRAGRIRRFLHEFHQKPLRLSDLASHLGLSASRTGHVVRSECGATFIDLLTRERLDAAARLLGDTALPVAAVARTAGFADPSRFHRCFRDRYGTTPAGFRRHGEVPEAP